MSPINTLAEQIKDWDIPDSDVVRIAPNRYPDPKCWGMVTMGDLRALIAAADAARELLIQLKTMLDQIDGDPMANQFFDSRLIANVKAAIAKAEEEPQESGRAPSTSTAQARPKTEKGDR